MPPPPLRPDSSRAERLYGTLPRPLQTLALTMQGWAQRRERYGRDFDDRLAGYLARDRVSEDEVRAERRRKLRRILSHAALHIPYWRDALRAAGIDPARVNGPEDLAALPVLTKSDVIRLGPALLWHGAPERSLRKVHTSGTTGAGLVFFVTADAVRDQWALWWRYRRAHGLTLSTWQATFGGRSIGWNRGNDARPWRTNYAGRQVLFSQYDLSPETAPAFLAELGRLRLPWFHGYPSFVAQLAAAHDAGPLRPRWITLGAENLLASQARQIRDAFGVAPIEHYGLAEMVANVSQCPDGRMHVDEDFAAVEFLPAGDGLHRIVGTSLENLAMPFVRYDTGDLARLADERCPCGRPGRIVAAIDGRNEDLLVLADGVRVGRLDHVFKDAVAVAEAQIRQRAPGACIVAIVPRAGWTRDDERRLLDEFRARFGDRLDVRIELVEAIPRTARGKLRLVVPDGGAPG